MIKGLLHFVVSAGKNVCQVSFLCNSSNALEKMLLSKDVGAIT